MLNFTYIPKINKIDFYWNPLNGVPNIKTPSTVTIEGYKITRLDTSDQSSAIKTIMGKSDLTADRGDGFDNTMEIPGYKYRYVIEPYPIGDYYADTVYACSMPDGGFEGKITSLSGMGVPGIQVCAVRLDTVLQDTTSRYCTLTDQQGNFNINEVYYYTGSDFMLQPSFKDHGFKLSELSYYTENKFRLENENHALSGISFTDTSSIVFQGKVLQPGFNESCSLGLENIKIKVYRDTLFKEVYTDETGFYSVCVDGGDNYSFVAELYNHSFTPDSFSLDIYCDTTLTTIIDNTVHKLSGYIYGACKTYFGQAKIKIYEGKTDAESCIDTIISTNSQGYYEILLPANKYTISVEEFISTDSNVENETVVGYFTSQEVDLTKDSVRYNFIYRNTPRLEIVGLNNIGCGIYEDIAIVKQEYTYPLKIKVYDVFGEITCPADTGFVTIKDKTGYSDIDTTIFIQNGEAVYFLKPGYPNLVADFQKNITITATIEKESITESKDLIVEGTQPMENTFLTTSPEIPLFILHDPPGDNSYAYLQQESSSQIAIGNIQHEVKNTDGYSNEWKVCPTTSLTLWDIWSFEMSAGWRRIKTVSVDSVNNKSSETIIEMDHKQGYQSSSDPALTGSTGGDVYIGGALNLIYAETQQVKYNYNTCQVDIDWDISIMPHSLATDFIYSENHIRNYLVPEFERLQRLFELQNNDSASFFEDQKNIWLTALANNQKNLSDSSTFIKRISFDGGVGPISEETTNMSTVRNSYEFHAMFDTTVTHYWKAEVAGIGYERSNVKSKIKIETGTDSSYTSTEGTTTGFVLKDDDIGDKFMVNVYNDNVYGTPAFKLVSGNSSCPYETGTRPREGVQLTANKYVAFVDDPNGTAVFRLQLANLSQTSETRKYNLFFHQGSNPDGAQLTLGGSQIQAGVPIPYTLPSWGFTEATVTVKRGPEAFDYYNLMFTLESGCDDNEIIDTLLLDVHFKNTCSNLFMINPADNWVISSLDEGKLKATLSGYNSDLLYDITIQICNENNYNSWYSLKYLTSSELEPEQTDVNLLLDEIEDGNYEIRARLECEAGQIYTKPIKGIKDSHGPQYFGVPEPADNVLDSVDIISVLFSENINSQAFSNANIICMNETSKTNLYFNAECHANQISIFPEFPSKLNPSDVYRVFVFGLEDLYGNKMKDTISWAFSIRVTPENNDICVELKAIQGWNIISLPVIPDSTGMSFIFQSMMDRSSLIKIQDESGNSMEDWGIFGGWVNKIGNIAPTEGYKIKVSINDSTEICGEPIKYPFAIPLKSGWNIMGYPQTSAFDALEVLNQLIDEGKLIKVQNEGGNSIEDWGIYGGWHNYIGDFIPGEGYNIKLNADDILWINKSYTKSSAIQTEIIKAKHFKPALEGNGMDHMNIHLVGLPINLLHVGDELAIFDGSTCVGAVTIMPRHLQTQTASIAASSRDNQGMPGFAEGNPVTLKLWASKQNREFTLEPEIVKGTSTFAKHETTFASLEKYAATGLEGIAELEFTEINCYPNPFSNEINIEIRLVKESEVQVEVLNQLGQRVRFLQTAKMMNSGVHRLMWNGKNAGNQSVSSGIYHLKITVDEKEINKKIVYSK